MGFIEKSKPTRRLRIGRNRAVLCQRCIHHKLLNCSSRKARPQYPILPILPTRSDYIYPTKLVKIDWIALNYSACWLSINLKPTSVFAVEALNALFFAFLAYYSNRLSQQIANLPFGNLLAWKIIPGAEKKNEARMERAMLAARITYRH